MEEILEGIVMLGPFGPYHNACWILHRGSEAAVIEMPPYRKDEQAPWLAVEKFLKARRLRLRFAFLSHAHIDHCQTLLQFRQHFPRARFVAHQSVLEAPLVARLAEAARDRLPRGLFGRPKLFHETFRSSLWSGTLGGEPVHLLHAPKHSDSDHLILFRGAMMTGDWFLGDLKDCNALVPPARKKRSISRVTKIVERLGYHVHTMYSAHGDCIYRQVDFHEMMRRSKIDHDEARSA
ncbi:MAG: MBL fold metallo-hydrolase [Candidatus Eremiobacteraeota bacterium]|nr:MBL fold metallo-hydrolase [Candidatus Eremiobacteraeota bacterium]